MTSSVIEKYFSGLLWVFIDKAGSGGINFVFGVVLARLLAPEDFGLVAMVMILYAISSTFVESGFSMALIRMKDISNEDKSTTFVFNFISSIIIYLILYCIAPAVSSFFNQIDLIPIIRVMSLNLIISSFSIIQFIQLSHKIDFKTQTRVRVYSVIVGGSIAILLAFLNFGVWSLVAKFVITATTSTILLCYFNKWVPTFYFSIRSFKHLFSFGWKILVTALVDKLFLHLYNILIGKYFTASILGFYTQAAQFKNLIIFTLFHTIEKVSYSSLSKLKEDKNRLKNGFKSILQMSSFVIIPSLLLLGILAKPFILALIGEKWLPAVPFLQLLCVSGLAYHISRLNLSILLVAGHPNLNMKLEIVRKSLVVVVVFIGFKYGILGLLISEVISAHLGMVVSAYYAKRFLDYDFIQQIKDIQSTILISMTTGFLVFWLFEILNILPLGQLLVCSVLGVLIYLSLHVIVNSREMKILNTVVIPRARHMISKR